MYLDRILPDTCLSWLVFGCLKHARENLKNSIFCNKTINLSMWYLSKMLQNCNKNTTKSINTVPLPPSPVTNNKTPTTIVLKKNFQKTKKLLRSKSFRYKKKFSSAHKGLNRHRNI